MEAEVLSNESSAVWPIEAHTQAKHEILGNYLKAWFPILSSWAGRIIYLDGFAGPGVYSGGEHGSPVIALQTAVEHTLRMHFKEVVFFFIEKDKNRATKLTEVLRNRFPNLPKNIPYRVQGAEFAPTLEQLLDELEKREAKLAPTFAFLDPFGFSGFPMKLIGRMMRYQSCEVLITFMAGFVKRFLDELRAPVLNELFASDEWKQACDIKDPEKRLRFLLDLYERQLKNVGGAKYVRSFGMIGPHNQLIYYLVFGTKHWKGLEVMKEAMWKVDRRGTYKFSDLTDVDQTYVIDYADRSIDNSLSSNRPLRYSSLSQQALIQLFSLSIDRGASEDAHARKTRSPIGTERMEQTAEQSSLILRMLAEFPYLPTPLNVIDAALELVKLGPDDVFADLGCGDGVVLTRVAERFAVFCVGFEIDRRLVKMARENARVAGLGHLVDVVHSDFFTVDISRFSVIYVYPFPPIARSLSEKIVRECSKGSRILVHDYALDHQHPVKVINIPSRAFHTHTIYLYKR